MRKKLVAAHRWLGLLIGFLWALQGLTGASLVWWHEIDHVTAPTASTGPTASLDVIMAAARAAASGSSIGRLTFTDSHRELIDAYYQRPDGERRAARIDAASARLVGDYPLAPSTPFRGAPLRWAYQIHSELNAGARGEWLIGLSGLFLLITVTVGLWLGWPARGRWRNAFAANRWHRWDQQLFGWHRALGLIIGAVFLLLAMTGASMIFNNELRGVLVTLLPFERVYSPTAHASGDPKVHIPATKGLRITTQEAVLRAEGHFPGSHWVRVFPPTPAHPFYTIGLYQKGEGRAWVGSTIVDIDPDSGGIIQAYDPLHAPIANRLMDALYPLHTGEYVGVPGRLVAMVSGLTLPALYVTGVWAWMRRRSQKSRKRKAADSRERADKTRISVE